MKKINNINESMFYKSNRKIHSNLWKVYIFGLIISLIVILPKVVG